VTFERSRDWDLIKSIVTHPKVYPHVSDDFSPSPGFWEPIESEQVWYVTVRDGCELLGLWAFIPENHICWKVHTCLLPIAYGQRAARAAKEMARWVWENTPCLRLITDVPAYNLLAHRFAERAGMVEFGVNPASYQKNGVLYDQIMLGMSRPEERICH
jgi:RimJ/RimL family protein N-acetyltransferase